MYHHQEWKCGQGVREWQMEVLIKLCIKSKSEATPKVIKKRVFLLSKNKEN